MEKEILKTIGKRCVQEKDVAPELVKKFVKNGWITIQKMDDLEEGEGILRITSKGEKEID